MLSTVERSTDIVAAVESFFDPGEKPGLYGLLHLGLPYMATILGFVASILITIVVPGAGEQSTLIGQLTAEPFWVPEIVAGLLLGWLAYETVPSKIAFIAWAAPGSFLLWSAWSWQRRMAVYDSTWDTYFGRHCGGSECLYQLFLTVPFYSSIFYSIGAFSKYIVARRTKQHDLPHSVS
jgi:hypothetical protein